MELLTPITLFSVFATLLGIGVAYGLTRHIFTQRLNDAQGRLVRSQKARQMAAEQHAQMRRQIDILSKELEAARRVRIVVPQPVVKSAAADLFVDDGMFIIGGAAKTGFADTLPYKH